MNEKERELEEEMLELKEDLENFKREKEQVRVIVGKIGGVPTFNTKLVNFIFVIFIFAPLSNLFNAACADLG